MMRLPWDDLDLPLDNLDLERSLRLPKWHERRIHGHADRPRGPSLLLVLAAHASHPDPFRADELVRWVDAPAPPSQNDCGRRRRIMSNARSPGRRSLLLAGLKLRYRSAVRAS